MPSGKQATDEELMIAYVGGDPGAFAELFSRYGPRLVRLFARDLGGRDELHDLVQQTFLHVHRARNDFRTDARLRPWLFTIALNLKRQHFRRLGRRQESSLDQEGAAEPVARGGDPEADVADAQLRRALAQLPSGQREVIILHWFEGLSFREIADVVGAGVSAVKVRAHRGYEKLRHAMVQARPGGEPGAKSPGGNQAVVRGIPNPREGEP